MITEFFIECHSFLEECEDAFLDCLGNVFISHEDDAIVTEPKPFEIVDRQPSPLPGFYSDSSIEDFVAIDFPNEKSD